jgi:hypothetical protein
MSYSDIEARLISKEIPEATRSYSPVDNKNVIDLVHKILLSKLGQEIINPPSFRVDDNFNSMLLKYYFTSGKTGQEGVIIVQNSYNKRKKLNFIMAKVFEGGVIAIDNQLEYTRKHTGKILDEFDYFLNSLLNDEGAFDSTRMDKYKKHMEMYLLSPLKAYELLYKMDFLLENILQNGHLISIKKKLKKGSSKLHIPSITLWDFYRIIQSEILVMHSYYQVDSMKSSFNFLTSDFGISY